MLSKIATASAIAAFVCLILAFGYQEWVASQSLNSPIQQERAAQNKDSAQKHSANEREKPEDALARYTFWLMLFTGILAVATVGLEIATVGLYLTGEKQISVAKESADAARLNTEALISAERAHLFVLIEDHTLHKSLMGAVLYENPDSSFQSAAITTVSMVNFAVKNTGRTAAILTEISYQLTQHDLNHTDWRYPPEDTIIVPVIEGGQKTAPPTSCDISCPITVADARAALNGTRPLFFYGRVAFRDAFRRQYLYSWRYEYRSRRFLLVDEREEQKAYEPNLSRSTQ